MNAQIIAQNTLTFLRQLGTCDELAIELSILTARRATQVN